jgi:hypothetical protein
VPSFITLIVAALNAVMLDALLTTKCQYANVILLSVGILNVIMLNVILNVMLNVMLNVIMLNVIMQNVVMLSSVYDSKKFTGQPMEHKLKEKSLYS